MAEDTITKPLRIVHCFREPTGGLFRHVCDLARYQASQGHQVGIICDADTGGPHENEILKQLQPQLALGLYRLPMLRQIGLSDFKTAINIYRIIKKLQPDILHGHGAKGGVYARLSGSALRVFSSRVARIYSPHGGSLHYDHNTLRGRGLFLIERMLARRTDAVIFVSNEEKKAYEEKIGTSRSLHAVIYNGLAPEEFTAIDTNADATDLLFIGTMRELKGPDILIRAIASIRDKHGIALSATMVGDGKEKPQFVALAQELDLGKQIRFLAGMPAKEAFALGRIMVIPSRAEAFPYIVLESLAAQKLLIASKVGGIPEVFDADSRALVEPNHKAVAVKILDVLSHENDYRVSQPSVNRLRERFDLSVMASSIELVYREALS